MESSTPGFIAQLNGKPTNQCYRTSKISLGHHIDMTYVHLQRGLSSEETVEAKKVFEAYAPDLRCEDQSLSCRQRPICRQSLPTGSQARRPDDNLLWSECSLPKRQGKKTNQGPPRANKEATSTCKIEMAKRRGAVTVALRPTSSDSPEELSTEQGRRLLAIGEVLQDLRRPQALVKSCLQVSCIFPP